MSIIKSITDKETFFGTTTQKALESIEVVESNNDINFSNCTIKAHGWFFDGVRIIHGISSLKKPCTFEWNNELEVVHLHFNLKGKMTIKHKSFNTAFSYQQLEHNIAYGNGFKGTVEYQDLFNENFIVQFTKEAFLKITWNANDILKQFGNKIMKGKPIVLSSENLVINIQIYSIIQNIINCKLEGKLRGMYLWSKCMELLVLQADSFDKFNQSEKTICKSDYDKERLYFARDYILNHIDNPLTIKELSRIAGMNEFKLKKGFKQLFGNTIFGMLSDYRLEKAYRELFENKKSASELAIELGYSSLSHFSNAFKKKFGYSPGKVA